MPLSCQGNSPDVAAVGAGRHNGQTHAFLLTPLRKTYGVSIGSDALLPEGKTYEIHGTKDAEDVRAKFKQSVPSVVSSLIGHNVDFPTPGDADKIYAELELYTDQVQPGDNFIFYFHGHGRGDSQVTNALETLVLTLDPDEIFNADHEIVDEDLAHWFSDPVRKNKWDGVNKLFILVAPHHFETTSAKCNIGIARARKGLT